MRFMILLTTCLCLTLNKGMSEEPDAQPSSEHIERIELLMERWKFARLTGNQSLRDEVASKVWSLQRAYPKLGETIYAWLQADLVKDASQARTKANTWTVPQIKIDQQFVPLIIDRNKYAAQFGENHPTVKAIDAEIAAMKGELKSIVRDAVKARDKKVEEHGRRGEAWQRAVDDWERMDKGSWEKALGWNRKQDSGDAKPMLAIDIVRALVERIIELEEQVKQLEASQK